MKCYTSTNLYHFEDSQLAFYNAYNFHFVASDISYSLSSHPVVSTIRLMEMPNRKRDRRRFLANQ